PIPDPRSPHFRSMSPIPPASSAWTCPKCGRVWRLQGGSADIVSCPLCALNPAGSHSTATQQPASSPPPAAAGGPAGGPGGARQLWNAARALSQFVADGCQTIPPDEYQERLEICEACDRQRNGRCLECGCWLSLKARGRAWQCPLDKWPRHDSPPNPAAPR
ncbi:MAG: DUF6171 family protein, partial [Planctomycetaceae bacterium]